MTERLLDLIEPDGADRRAVITGWIAGGILGMIIAICALLVLTGTPIPT